MNLILLLSRTSAPLRPGGKVRRRNQFILHLEKTKTAGNKNRVPMSQNCYLLKYKAEIYIQIIIMSTGNGQDY